MVLEIVNSIMERFADAVQPRMSSMVREVKDMMAGAVFLTALTAAAIGIMIFYPHFKTLLYAILGEVSLWG
jgi:diacylglycerol kinase